MQMVRPPIKPILYPLSKFRDTEHLQLGKDDARLEAGEFQTHCASNLHFISSLSTVISTY